MEMVNSNDPSAMASRTNARGTKGWLKFLGILSIVYGALYALSIVGVVFAWMPIWLGIVMTKAGGRAGDYAERGDQDSLAGYTKQLKTLFTVMGVVTLVSIALGIILGIVGLVVGVFSGTMLPDLLEQFGF
ncbi:MAG: DUF5362 domain-containing protein [bacterium]